MFLKILIVAVVPMFFLSCDGGREELNAGAGSPDSDSVVSKRPKRSENPLAASGRLRSKVPGMEARLTLLRVSGNSISKRELFAGIMLDLPTEEHEVAVELVVDDLNSKAPANLVSEYLEMSSLMSPALQLPGIVRLLEEPALPILQRAAMEHQLRQDLEISAGQEVQDWRPLVQDHLKKDPSLIGD